jgi:hypothetical protein
MEHTTTPRVFKDGNPVPGIRRRVVAVPPPVLELGYELRASPRSALAAHFLPFGSHWDGHTAREWAGFYEELSERTAEWYLAVRARDRAIGVVCYLVRISLTAPDKRVARIVAGHAARLTAAIADYARRHAL